jgi:cell division protein FtsW
MKKLMKPLIEMQKYLAQLEVVDYRTIVSIVFLMMFGFIMVYSASNATQGTSMVLKQTVIGIIGLVVMMGISLIDYHIYAKWAGMIYLLSVGSLFLVKVPGLGVTKNGASRWIEIAGQSFQPAELLKPAMIILMSYLLVQIGRKLTYIRACIYMFIPGCIAVVLILFITRNMSTALIVLGIMAVMFFVAHPNKKIWGWVIFCLIVLVVGALVFYNVVVVKEHASTDNNFRVGRILAWLYPSEYTDLSMQSRYALYAIGFGGLLGRGLGSGTMKYYLPEPMNDFIFAVIAEELGVVGCLMVIFLFVYQVWRILTISKHAKDLLGTYMALGVGAHVAIQVILNIGVATSVLPNTGISLPYISYGGTALFLQLCEMGILLNISRQIPGKRIKVEGTTQLESDQEQTRESRIA